MKSLARELDNCREQIRLKSQEVEVEIDEEEINVFYYYILERD